MAPSVSVFSGGSRPSDRKGGGAGHPDREIRGGQPPPPKKKIVLALRASVWS